MIFLLLFFFHVIIIFVSRNIVLIIEHDLHDKTSALFDAYSSNNDEHQIINTRLCDLENLALKNSVLEDTTRFSF